MFSKSWVWLFFFPLYAIDVATSVSQISNEGRNQLLGSFSLIFSANDFADAAPDHPLYIRISLARAHGWSQTLVDQRAGTPEPYKTPINLALYPTSPSSTLNPALPADAIQLARLVEGENSLWLRINRSSSEWALLQNLPAPPGSNQSFALTVGIQAEISLRPTANTQSGGNERAGSTEPCDTRLRADYADTPHFQVGDHESIDLIAYDSTTSGVESGQPVEGSDLGVTFSNDYKIAVAGNIVPCFDLHLDPEIFEAPPHRLVFSRLDRVGPSQWQRELPAVYLSNTSDFPWSVGTRIRLGGYQPPDPSPALPFLVDSSIQVLAADGTWRVRRYPDSSSFTWELELLSGQFPINARIQVAGLRFQIPCIPSHNLVLSAVAEYLNPEVTGALAREIGPVTRTAAVLNYDEADLSTQIFPLVSAGLGVGQAKYTPGIRLFNPGESPRRFALFAYNLNGRLLAILPARELAPRASFGSNSELIAPLIAANSWWELVSDGPLYATAYLADANREWLDLQEGLEPSAQLLYGLHLPQRVESWETTVHFVSTDHEQVRDYRLHLPDGTSSRVPNMALPGSLGVMGAPQFEGASGRASYFSIESPTPTGVGSLLISAREPSRQLASFPLNQSLARSWTFQHLGSPVGGWWNGLVLTNPGPDPLVANLERLDSRGAVLQRASIEVPAKSRIAQLVESLLGSDENGSSLTIRADRDLLAGLMIGQQGKDVLTLVTPSAPPSKRWVMPILLDPDHYWTAFTIANQSDEPTRISMSTRNEQGQLLETVALELAPRQKRNLLLSEQFGSLSEVRSLELQSTRPLVLFALTGSQKSLGTLPVKPLL